MYVLLEKGDVIRKGDEMKDNDGPGWHLVLDIAIGLRLTQTQYWPLRRKLTGWAAVTHAIKAEVLGNDKEGCETIPWMWECECDKDFLHVYSEFPKCNKCGAWDSDQPNARKAEVILEIIEET